MKKYLASFLCLALAVPAWAGDELTPTLADRKVTQDLGGVPLRANAPTNGQVLTYSSATGTVGWGSSSGGVPSIAGTANQINESGSPGATTLTLSSTVTLPGTLTLGGTLTSGANTLAFSGATITGSPASTLGATTVATLGSSGTNSWATGGSYAVGATGELYGPTDTGMFATAGSPAGTGSGQAFTVAGGVANTTGAGGLVSAVGGAGVGSNQNGGGFTADPGASTGTGTSAVLIKGYPVSASSSSANSASTVLTINGSGFVYAGLQNATTVGAISLTASAGGTSSGAGGGITLVAGQAGTAGGATGAVTITGGANTFTSGSTAGGAVSITGGANTAGGSTGNGGAVSIAGGAAGSSSGTGGAVSLIGGIGTSGTGGLATLSGGDAQGVANQNSGGIIISTGKNTGTGTASILFNVPPINASGSTQGTPTSVLTISGSGFVYAGTQNSTTVGNVSLTAAKGGISSGAGGNASLIAGTAGTAGGACGMIVITGGANAVASGSTAGGQVGITGGACSGTTSTGAGGALVFAGGLGGTTSGTGGAASFTGGAGQGSTSGVGGLVTIAGGAGSTDVANQAAGGVTITSGLPSGNATANVRVQSGFTGASGASVQTTYDRALVAGHSLTCSNTTATPTFVLDLNLATANSGGGCTVFFCFEVADASNHAASVCGSFIVAASNNNGTVIAAVDTLGTGNQVTSSTTTFTALTMAIPTPTISTTHVQINVAPTWSGGTVTSALFTYTAICNGRVTMTAQ